MAKIFEATLRMKGDDQTAAAFQAAAQRAKQFREQQTENSRALRQDTESIGRAFRQLRGAMALGGATAFLDRALTQAGDFDAMLNRIGINARASAETMKVAGQALRAEADRLNRDNEEVVGGFDAWRIASGQSVDAALKSFPQIGTAANAMQADIDGVAKLVGTLRTNLEIRDDSMPKVLDQIAASANAAGVPFDQFASHFARYSDQMYTLGLTGDAGLQQMLGTFNAINKQAANAGKSFEILDEVMNKAVDPNVLTQYRGGMLGFMRQAIQQGRGIVDVLGDLITSSGKADIALRGTFSGEVVELIQRVRGRTVDVKKAQDDLANATGTVDEAFRRSSEAGDQSLKRLKRSMNEIVLETGSVVTELDKVLSFKPDGSALKDLAADIGKLKNDIQAIAGVINKIIRPWTQGQKFTRADIEQNRPLYAGLTEEQKTQVRRQVEEDERKQGATPKTRPEFLGFSLQDRGVGRIHGLRRLDNQPEADAEPAAPAAPPSETRRERRLARRGLPGRQAGGPVTGGQPYVVGERGPELFVPHDGGRIVPDPMPIGRRGGARTLDTGESPELLDLTRRNTAAVAESTREERTLSQVLGELVEHLRRGGDESGIGGGGAGGGGSTTAQGIAQRFTGGARLGGGADPSAPFSGDASERERFLDAAMMAESRGQNVNNRSDPRSTASGYWQITDPTWRDHAPPEVLAKYKRAIDAPPDVQRMVAGRLYDRRGTQPWDASRHRWAPMLSSGNIPRPPSGAPAGALAPGRAMDGADLAQRTGLFGTPQQAGQNLVTVKAPNGASFRVHKDAAPQFEGFLKELSETGYNIQSSGGYNVRRKQGTGASGMSSHSYGTAIDVNAAKNMPGMAGDLPANVGEMARKHGLEWGGEWGAPGDRRRDTMHFEVAQYRAREQQAKQAAAEQERSAAAAQTQPQAGADMSGMRAQLAEMQRMRAELSKPIPLRFEHQPGAMQAQRSQVRRQIDREIREAAWSSYADV